MGASSEGASRSIRAELDDLAKAALDLQSRRWPHLRAALSDEQYANMVQDTKYHLQFLASALWANEPTLYDDYVLWVKILFENLDLPAEWLSGSLADVRDAIAADLGDDVAERAAAIIDRSIAAIETTDTSIASYITPDQPLSSLAVRYLGAVLGGDRHGASRSILDAVAQGTPVRDIYTHVFQPAQLELGRLWQMNRISVAQEHYATAVTQMVMSQLYGEIFNDAPKEHTLVAACVGAELHELGLRMVTDFFEMDGWDTHYLGANMPAASIVATTAERGADVLALSVTMSFRVEEVAEIIRLLHDNDATKNVKVLVGGYPFNLAPDLWKRVGADNFARSAPEALTAAAELVA